MRLVLSAPPPRASIDGPRLTPWLLRDLARLIRFEAVAFIAIVVCFVGARHTHSWDAQLYWIVGGMAAMLVSGVGWATWLLIAARGLRVRQRRLAEITAALAPAASAAVLGSALVTAKGMKHYHRKGCVFVEHRPVTAATATQHAARGLAPCPACIR